MSVSDSVSSAVIKWGGFVNFCHNPEITAVRIWRTSNTGPQQEGQSVVGDIDGQLTVSPTRRQRAPVPAKYGESMTSEILFQCH